MWGGWGSSKYPNYPELALERKSTEMGFGVGLDGSWGRFRRWLGYFFIKDKANA